MRRVIISAGLWMVLACGGGGPKAPAVEHAVGTPIPLEGWTVTVHGARAVRTVGSAFVKHAAGEGAELLLVDITAENTSKKPMVVAGKIALEDADGRTFTSTPGCMFALKDQLGELEQIQPGLKKRGPICFEVPRSLSLRVGIRPHVFAPPQWVPL